MQPCVKAAWLLLTGKAGGTLSLTYTRCPLHVKPTHLKLTNVTHCVQVSALRKLQQLANTQAK